MSVFSKLFGADEDEGLKIRSASEVPGTPVFAPTRADIPPCPTENGYVVDLEGKEVNEYGYSLVKNVEEAAALPADSSGWEVSQLSLLYLSRGMYIVLSDEARAYVDHNVGQHTLRRLFAHEPHREDVQRLLDDFTTFFLAGPEVHADFYLLLVEWGWVVNGMFGPLVDKYWKSLDNFQTWAHRYGYRSRMNIKLSAVDYFSQGLVLVEGLNPRLDDYFKWLLRLWRRGRYLDRN